MREADLRGALSWTRGAGGLPERAMLPAVAALADTDPARMQILLAAAEYSCVVLQTLRKGVTSRRVSSGQCVKLPSSGTALKRSKVKVRKLINR